MSLLRLFIIVGLAALAALAGRGDPAYAWTAPAALNTNAGSDTGWDKYPQVTTDGAGNLGGGLVVR